MQGRKLGAIYGPLAFGTSAHSSVLTDWPGGGVIGIHGTNQPGLLPGRVSHGCIRLRNRDILRLGRRLKLGTPITIRCDGRWRLDDRQTSFAASGCSWRISSPDSPVRTR